MKTPFKKLKYLFLLVMPLCFLTMEACQDESMVVNSTGRIGLSLITKDAHEAGRSKTNFDKVSAALVSIETAAGALVCDLREVKLVKLGGQFISEEIELGVGDYVVTKFLVVDSAGAVLFATPIANSALAHLVENPLPVGFTVTAENTSTLHLEAVSIGVASPEDFGYAAFSLGLIEYAVFDVFTSVASDDHTGAVNGSLQVIAKNDSNQVVWDHTFEITDTASIAIPKYAKYAFTFSEPGFISHIQYYQLSDLEHIHTLYFELIPEDTDDILSQTILNGEVTIRYPADRTKLYTRIDVSEDLPLSYLFADRLVTDVTGLPLMDVITIEHFGPALQEHPVNIYGNMPFAQSPGIRDSVEMDYSTFTEDFDRDVLVSTFIAIDSPEGFDYLYSDWDFDTGPFYDHWCPIFHFPECEDTAGNSAGREAMKLNHMKQIKSLQLVGRTFR